MRRIGKGLIAFGLAVAVWQGLDAQVVRLRVRPVSAWAVHYEPLTYPHPLQATYDEDLCENDINVTVDMLGVTPSHARADVVLAINDADDDDCVFIPAVDGAETWSSGVSVLNERLQIIGPGESSLTITCTAQCITFRNSASPTKPFRLSGLTFVGTGEDMISVLSDGVNAIVDGFRIDHVTIVGTATHGIYMNGGMAYGLIDHFTCDSTVSGIISECSFLAPWLQIEDNSTLCTGVAGTDCMGYYSWFNRAVTLGSDDQLVYEDSTYKWLTTGGVHLRATQDTGALGATRITFRYNTVTCGSFQTHGARGFDRGMASSEVYRSSFSACSGATRVALLHNGVQYWFQNTIEQGASWGHNLDITSYRANTTCGSTSTAGLHIGGATWADPFTPVAHAWDGNLEASGWPLLDDVGRLGGASQTTDVEGTTWEPYKAWSNGTTSTCKTGGSCNNSSVWAVNSACTNGGGAHPYTLTDYYKPYNNPHTNAAGALGPANMWDYMDETVGGVTVYTNVSDLPSTCTPNTVAWVKNAGTWNTSGNGHGSGVLYKCR
jgi:hypothetical protein